MTFTLYPLDPFTPVLDTIGEPPALDTLPVRLRSWACQTGSALCEDPRCLCTCHTEAASTRSWDGFAAGLRRQFQSALDETAHELSGSRDGFHFGYVGPRTLADIVGGETRRIA